MAPDDYQANLRAQVGVLIAISITVVVIRCWSCLVLRHHRFGWDDGFAIAALPFVITAECLIARWVDQGFGKHAALIPLNDLEQAGKLIFAGTFIFEIAVALPKFSVLCFYRRVFAKTKRGFFHPCLWVVIALNTGWLVSSLFHNLFLCWPVKAAYTPFISGRCFPQWIYFIGVVASSVMVDTLILMLPLPLIWNIKMSWQKKTQVISTFLCGYSVVSVSAGCLVAIIKTGSTLEEDITWTTVTYIMWLQCVTPISLVCVSLPTMYRFFKYIHENGFLSVLVLKDQSTNRYIRSTSSLICTCTDSFSTSPKHRSMEVTSGLTYTAKVSYGRGSLMYRETSSDDSSEGICRVKLPAAVYIKRDFEVRREDVQPQLKSETV